MWTNDVGVSVTGNSITKTDASGWGNAGAASTRGLNGDGYAEFTVPADPGYAMFGLSNGDSDQSYADIDFAFYTYPPTGQLYIFESGASRGSYGGYSAGDTLSISLEAGIVKYYRNGSCSIPRHSPQPSPPCRHLPLLQWRLRPKRRALGNAR